MALSARGGVRATSSQAVTDDHNTSFLDGEEDDMDLNFARREERMSPAAVVASKRLGIAVLPQALVEGITAAVKGE
jgi:hypothetical protein